MIKFINKHKFFLIVLLALVTLTLGFFFVFKDDKFTSAGAASLNLTYKAYWSNSSDTSNKKTGKYISKDGNELDDYIGTINCKTVKATGGSWSSGGGTNTKNSNKASARFYAYNNDMRGGTSFSYEIIFETPARSGFYLCSESGNRSYKDSGFLNYWSSGKNVSGSFEAVFAPSTYDISFYANGGTFPDGTGLKTGKETFYEDYAVINDIPTPTRVGYTFAGWYTAAMGGTKITSDTRFDDTSRLALHAHWEPEQYIINFDQTGGTGGMASTIVTYDQMVPNIYDFPTRNGYTFEGYYDKDYELDPTGTQYYDKNGNGLVVYKIAGHMYWAYARWEPKKIAITLNSQGADAKGSTMAYFKFDTEEYFKTCTQDGEERVLSDPIAKIELPTKTGYTFKGYYTEKNGGGTQYIDANGNFVNNLYNSVYDDSTLYACWYEHSYKIRFHPNGGEGEMYDSEDIAYSETYSLPENKFTYKTYLFKGWALSSYGDVEYRDTAAVTNLAPEDKATVIFYAVWEATWATKAIEPEGNGTENSPYLISTPENLAWISYKIEHSTADLGGYFKQTANINLNGATWLPIGNQDIKFIGCYDGNGYAITNLATTQIMRAGSKYLYSYQGLFGNISNATIENVNILSGTIYGHSSLGGLVGKSQQSSIISSTAYVTITADGIYAGGLIGDDISSTIKNCYVNSTINGTNYLGGLIGQSSSSTIESCGVECSVPKPVFLAKRKALICGSASSTTITNCFAKSSESRDFYVGSATVTNSLYEAGSSKYYYNGTFSNWVISTTLTPLPSGLSWLAKGGTKVTSVSQISDLGYVLKS